MDIPAELAARVDKLTPEMQERVLRFVSCLDASLSKSEGGIALRRFAGTLDELSARGMIQAIEANANAWMPASGLVPA